MKHKHQHLPDISNYKKITIITEYFSSVCWGREPPEFEKFVSLIYLLNVNVCVLF